MANLSAEVTLTWADGQYHFALKLPQIDELQRLCNAGIGTISRRVHSGDFFFADIYETIRLGLIGGGTNHIRALQLVQTYVIGQPLVVDPDEPGSPLAVARAVLEAVFFGIPDNGEDSNTGKDQMQ